MVHLFDPKKLRQLESPDRAEWQRPREIIAVLEIAPGNNVLDFGAGTGYFSVILAQACSPQGTVFAVDKQREMIDYLNERIKNENLSNVTAINSDGLTINLPSGSVDLVYTANTFHELEMRGQILREFKRLFKTNGRLVIVDWAPVESPMGPPISERLSIPQVTEIAGTEGFILTKNHIICDYHYVLEFGI